MVVSADQHGYLHWTDRRLFNIGTLTDERETHEDFICPAHLLSHERYFIYRRQEWVILAVHTFFSEQVPRRRLITLLDIQIKIVQTLT